MECDVCKNWQHRTCNSGISRPVKEDVTIEWLCHNCKNDNESIVLFESDVDQSSLNLDETIRVSFSYHISRSFIQIDISTFSFTSNYVLVSIM